MRKYNDSDLIGKMMSNINGGQNKNCKKRNILVNDLNNKCVCQDDEPCTCQDPENMQCNCIDGGLYMDDKLVEAETKHELNNKNNNEAYKDIDNSFEENFVEDECDTNSRAIYFELNGMPLPEEVATADMWYDSVTGRQMLTITVIPYGKNTYLDKFIRGTHVGPVKLVNIYGKLSDDVVLTENGICHGVDTFNLLAENLKYRVNIEL